MLKPGGSLISSGRSPTLRQLAVVARRSMAATRNRLQIRMVISPSATAKAADLIRPPAKCCVLNGKSVSAPRLYATDDRKISPGLETTEDGQSAAFCNVTSDSFYST